MLRIGALLVLSMTAGGAGGAPTVDAFDLPLSGWRLVTDGVMGGVSRGSMTHDSRVERPCIALRGHVSTANNGGFIQIALDLDPSQRVAADYDGIRITVAGNGESYNLHLRTSALTMPWQSFRSTFAAQSDWQDLYLPFDGFSAYRTTAALDPAALRRIGIVAIGREFDAELCLASIAFYRMR